MPSCRATTRDARLPVGLATLAVSFYYSTVEPSKFASAILVTGGRGLLGRTLSTCNNVRALGTDVLNICDGAQIDRVLPRGGR